MKSNHRFFLSWLVPLVLLFHFPVTLLDIIYSNYSFLLYQYRLNLWASIPFAPRTHFPALSAAAPHGFTEKRGQEHRLRGRRSPCHSREGGAQIGGGVQNLQRNMVEMQVLAQKLSKIY